MSILNENGAVDLGLNSVKDNDELGVLRSIDFLTERGTEYIKKRLEPDAKKAVINIRDIGNAAVVKKMEIGVFLSLLSLGKMAEVAREKKTHETGFSILHSLCAIGRAAAGQKMGTAVRIAVAYLEEIVNASSLQKMEREALNAALAIGAIGEQTFEQRNIRVIDNGGLLIPISTVFSSHFQEKEAIILSKEYLCIPGLPVQKERKSNFSPDMPVPEDQNYFTTDFTDIESLIVRASYSLGTIILQTNDRFLISHMLMTKLALETFDGSKYIHEADSFD